MRPHAYHRLSISRLATRCRPHIYFVREHGVVEFVQLARMRPDIAGRRSHVSSGSTNPNQCRTGSPPSQCRYCSQCLRVPIDPLSEKLDYTLGVFTVERHIRGKWACKACKMLIQAPVPPHVIDKGAHCRIARAGAGRQIRRPLAAVSLGTDLWPCRTGHSEIHAQCRGGQVWRAVAAVGRRTPPRVTRELAVNMGVILRQ